MPARSLDQWLAWLERAHPTEIDLGLERIARVYQALALPRPPRVLTVAGTNGKGSCVAFAAAILQDAGLKVGSYTSPHLHHYCERVRINAEPVSDAAMCRAFTAVDQARGDTSLTYFEFGTLAALWLFAEARVDVAVLEVGLGGRLDAVNIIDPDVAVITSIAIDHEAWLGSDRNVIALEKAGIARPGIPLVCADRQPPESLAPFLVDLGAQPVWLGSDFSMVSKGQAWHFKTGSLTVDFPALALPADSVAAAIVACEKLGVSVTAKALQQCAAQIQLPGRMQALEIAGARVIVDVAHNPAAAEHLVDRLPLPEGAQVHWVIAMMADKDIAATLQPLQAVPGRWYLGELENIARAASPQTLGAHLAEFGVSDCYMAPVSQCLDKALESVAPGDIIVVLGSFFTVAAALQHLSPNDAGIE
ncbi:bifunctional tetrahydrofolate synthase/dihydrofolate synthase [Gilvimarinus xylanilyticus]|uniref:Dihydrofolate synthase/folylpolyglutamate synthase n=1 Tax=Gilvimarinus xylanilyticus TaxID=2944139 RepID=A0A9X2I1B7_9GAMM|nr:bifunctional tetrahydrofolate synthase/dihydrofolate synthase [Gilvimarinus xylanilyticus]